MNYKYYAPGVLLRELITIAITNKIADNHTKKSPKIFNPYFKKIEETIKIKLEEMKLSFVSNPEVSKREPAPITIQIIIPSNPFVKPSAVENNCVTNVKLSGLSKIAIILGTSLSIQLRRI